MPGGCLDMPGALIGPLRANGGPSGNPQVRALRALRSSSSKWIWLRRSQAKSPLTRSGAWSIERVDSGRTFVRVAVEARDRATGGGGYSRLADDDAGLRDRSSRTLRLAGPAQATQR